MDKKILKETCDNSGGGFSVSHGTHRTEDLLMAFYPFLPEKLHQEIDALNGDFDGEDVEYILEEAFEEMIKAAPEGFYFGTLEGDGSDFGFWRIEQNSFYLENF